MYYLAYLVSASLSKLMSMAPNRLDGTSCNINVITAMVRTEEEKQMGIFGNKKTTPVQRASISPRKDIQRIIEESDKAIADMHKADAEFEKDGDIEKRIRTYEKYLSNKPQWNSFNFNLSLAKMYVKAGHNDKAWGYLNQMYLWAVDPRAVGGNVSKIRFEQFKILKAEKKYKDAMLMLVSSYVLNAYAVRDMYFNKSKFMKDAKTTAKVIGFTEEQLVSFADDLERRIKLKRIKESNVQKFCAEYFSRLNL